MRNENLHVIGYDEFEFANVRVAVIQADDGQFYLQRETICKWLNLDDAEFIQFLKSQFCIFRKDKPHERNLIRLDRFLLWLASINDLDNKTNMRKLEIYQAEAALVLQEALLAGRFSAKTALAQGDSVAIRAYREALVLVQLTRCHILQESLQETYTFQHRIQKTK